jgi:hypothetical protein
MAQSLKIYLADLTYDTITLSTEVFPLNIGYVAAYAFERLGDSLEVARRLLRHRELGPKSWRQFESVATYCRGVTSSLMEEGRLDRNKEAELDFDIGRWVKDETGQTLDQFKLNPSRRVSFQLGQDQVTLLTDLVATYGNTPAGRGQALKYIPENMLWRHSVVTQDSP